MTLDRVVLDLSESGGAADILARRAEVRGFRGVVGTSPLSRRGENARLEVYRFDGAKLVDVRRPGSVRPIVTLSGPGGIERVTRVAKQPGGVLVESRGGRVIPLESLIASLQERGSLWVRLHAVEEVPAALGALEKGAEVVVVPVRNAEQLDRLVNMVETAGRAALEWEIARVRRLEPAGIADRILVDTTSLLVEGEGILVGSHAAFLFAVLAETEGTRYTRPRPFRVNAGAPHSYVLMADGTTRYLSELKAGDAVLAVLGRDRSRAVRVGRLKIERRPMIFIHAIHRKEMRSLVLQEAETVRLAGGARPIAVTALRVGDRIAGVALPPGRHLGQGVRETVLER